MLPHTILLLHANIHSDNVCWTATCAERVCCFIWTLLWCSCWSSYRGSSQHHFPSEQQTCPSTIILLGFITPWSVVKIEKNDVTWANGFNILCYLCFKHLSSTDCVITGNKPKHLTFSVNTHQCFTLCGKIIALLLNLELVSYIGSYILK